MSDIHLNDFLYFYMYEYMQVYSRTLYYEYIRIIRYNQGGTYALMQPSSFVKGFFYPLRSKLGKISEKKTLNIGRCGTTYQSPDKTYDLLKIFSFYWISIPIIQEEEIRNRQNPVMDIPIYTVDAFAKVPFEGNPAAICLVDPEHVICLLK